MLTELTIGIGMFHDYTYHRSTSSSANGGPKLEAPPVDPLDLPTSTKSLSPPRVLPGDARCQWYESWQRLFLDRDEADAQCLEIGTEVQKPSWEYRARNAKILSQPGRKGAMMYVLEECDFFPDSADTP